MLPSCFKMRDITNLLRSSVLAASVCLFGCYEGGQVGTGGDFNQSSLSGNAMMAGLPITNAEVTVEFAGEAYLATTDASGNYTVVLEYDDDLDLDSQLVRVDVQTTKALAVSGFASATPVHLVSLPGSLAELRAEAGGVDSITIDDVASLSVTPVSSAQYGLLFNANAQQPITGETDRQSLENQIDLSATYELGALIELMATDPNVELPEQAEDTLDLLENLNLARTEIQRIVQQDSQAISNQMFRIAGRELANDCNNFVSMADLRGCDFSDAEVTSANLSMADFSYALLTDVVIANVNLQSANFAFTNANAASFAEADLNQANFISTVLTNSSFSHLESDDVVFRGSNLAGTSFSSTSYVRADFSGSLMADVEINESTFTDTDFSGANLTNAEFILVDLSRSDFTGANLTGAVFDNVTTDGVIWTGAICPDGTLAEGACDLSPAVNETPNCAVIMAGANLRGCDLSFMDLGAVDLSGADLSNANLLGTSLLQANLENAVLDGANFQYSALQLANLTLTSAIGTDFQFAALDQANLSEANLTDAQLDSATVVETIWSQTICPDGTETNVGCMQ